MKKDGKQKKNYSGQEVSDEPTEELINLPDPNRPKKPDKKSDRNTTAKDPNLSSRNPILR
jgi:hypothetical protein